MLRHNMPSVGRRFLWRGVLLPSVFVAVFVAVWAVLFGSGSALAEELQSQAGTFQAAAPLASVCDPVCNPIHGICNTDCTITCDATFADCNGSTSDGCECLATVACPVGAQCRAQCVANGRCNDVGQCVGTAAADGTECGISASCDGEGQCKAGACTCAKAVDLGGCGIEGSDRSTSSLVLVFGAIGGFGLIRLRRRRR